MRAVALISGGKDSCYNMMQCVGAGHTIVALANLQPVHKDELDSYMYQTVGHQGISLYAEAMGLPLYREIISGVAVDQGRNYKPTNNDEVEDLYRLLARIKSELDIEAVACGAILSDYQRIRVENVCQRLGLVSLAYLWRRNQKELLQEMIASGVEAIIIKVAALGLDPRIHLGLSLKEIQPHLLVMQEKYGLNVCGEGGEYETFTLDCPLFRKKLVIDEKEMVIHTEDPVASVGYLNLKLHLEIKENYETIELPPTVRNSLDFVKDLSDTVFSDISDMELSETEIESIEKLEKVEKNELNPLLTYSGDNVKGVSLSDNEYEESVEDGYYYDEMHGSSEIQPVLDHRTIYGNRHGWYFIGGIVGEGVDTAVATKDAMKKLISRFYEKYGLPGVIGCIDCTHIAIVRPSEHEEQYFNRKHFHSLNTQVICDSDCYITNVDASFGGATHDAYIWRECDIRSYMEGLQNETVYLLDLLDSVNLQLPDVCSVNIYMRDMEQYAALNKVYVDTFSFPNPPTRVCVQCPLPKNVGLILDGVAYKSVNENNHESDGISKERVTMHVQGISHWAPANIGPYSQAVKVGEVLGTCGQIALVPGCMTLTEGGARAQCSLALRHLTRVLRAAHPRAHIRSVVQSVCYVTGRGAAREARRQLERRTAGAIVQCAVVEALPRGACVEWHAWAHTDNNRFEYEETGCNVGDYKVAITRRWNYENTVAAIVCYVATGSSPSTCQVSFPDAAACDRHRTHAATMSDADLEAVMSYALRKLLNDCHEREPCPALYVRIFYQVWGSPTPQSMSAAAATVGRRLNARVALIAVPVVALHNAFTFLSISGLRFQE